MYNTSPVPYAVATIVVIGILIASIFGIASETDREKERAAENTTANEFVLVDTDIDTAEVGRYHHYSTILKFYLQEKTTQHIFSFIVPKEVYGSFQCGDTVTVYTVKNVTLFEYKSYYINNHSVSYEYRLQPDEETPVKHISEQSGKEAVQTSESGEQE